MKNKVKSIISHPLVSGSSVIFLGTLLGNVFNFFFSIYMLAHLSSADNGELITLVSLITIPNLAAGAISPAILSFAGGYFARKEMGKVHDLYIKIGKLYFIIGLALFLAILLATPYLSTFFKIEDHFVFVLINIAIFISIFYVLNTAFLQAKLAFGYISFLTILAAGLKLGIGILLVLWGYTVRGAIFAVFLSFFAPFVLSFFPLQFLFRKGVETIKINTKEFFTYGLPSSATILGMTSFITADLLLVKHFFSPTPAGFYASISLIGRIIFYFSAPISTVMFPLVVQKMNKKENYTNTFLLSVLLVLLPSVGITLFYFFFPDFIMHIFHVKNATAYQTFLLGMFGIYISLYAVVSILSNFFLSIKKTIIYIPTLGCALLQILGIWFFHDSFLTVISVSLVSMFLLLLVLLIYYPYATRE